MIFSSGIGSESGLGSGILLLLLLIDFCHFFSGFLSNQVNQFCGQTVNQKLGMDPKLQKFSFWVRILGQYAIPGNHRCHYLTSYPLLHFPQFQGYCRRPSHLNKTKLSTVFFCLATVCLGSSDPYLKYCINYMSNIISGGSLLPEHTVLLSAKYICIYSFTMYSKFYLWFSPRNSYLVVNKYVIGNLGN